MLTSGAHTSCFLYFATTLVLLPAIGATPHTWWIDSAAPNGGDGSQEFPFTTLAEAVQVANASDIVMVEAGSYTGPQNLMTIEIPLNIISVSGPFVTTFSYIQGGSLQLKGPTTASFLLSGITFSQASGFIGGIQVEGSGTYTLENCRFLSNAWGLGVIAISGGDAPNVVVKQSLFSGNGFGCSGGCGGFGAIQGTNAVLSIFDCIFHTNAHGFTLSSAVLHCVNCTILSNSPENENHAQSGGALVAAQSDISLTDCFIANNFVEEEGGAISVTDCSLIVQGGELKANNGSQGGGLYLKNTISVLNNTIIHENAAKAGGGVYLADHSSLTVIGGSVSDNLAESGAGFQCDSNAELVFLSKDASVTGNVQQEPSICKLVTINT